MEEPSNVGWPYIDSKTVVSTSLSVSIASIRGILINLSPRQSVGLSVCLSFQKVYCMELVDMFCYLGDMLSVDGDAVAAVETRIRIGWNKFRQLVPLLTNKDISLKVRGRLYSSYVQSSMLHGTPSVL